MVWPCSSEHCEVSDDEGSHGFENGYSAGQDTRVVAAAFGMVTECGGRLEEDPGQQRLAIGEAALNATVWFAALMKGDAGAFEERGVFGRAPPHAGHGADAGERVGQERLGLVEHGLAEADGEP